MTVLHLVIDDLGRLSSAVYFICFILICSHFIVLFFFINNGLLFLHYSFDLHTIFWLNGCGFFFGMHSYVPATSCLALLRII